MKHYIIRNEDCRKTIKTMKRKNIKVDCVLTSPPYNTSRKVRTNHEIEHRQSKYKYYSDNKPFQEYKDFILDVLNKCEEILKIDGTILMNLSYASSVEIGMVGSRLIELMFDVITYTNFEVADIIVWKKKSALPNNRSKNKCTRICEFVFVLCRKNEYMSFKSNKKIISFVKERGTTYYSNMYNYIEAKNNDGRNPYNNATFSVEFVRELLQMYVKDNSVVYDPFGGVGTTALACKKEKRKIACICSEIDKEQCEYGEECLRNG